MESVRKSVSASAPASVNSVPPFLSKTYDMVDDPSTNDVVSWSSGNNSFVVWSVPEFGKELLPKYFKHNNFSSFVRQLNTYGFRKVDPDRWEFANEGFLRGQKQLMKSIVRRKPAHVHNQQQPQVQNSSVGACVEVGKFGLEEEVERLKRDKNALMQELVRLRQQQQGTEHQLQTVGKKVQVMEQRQQQMMSFLAKAVQSPGFLNQLVQQQNDSTRHMAGSNKKRRLPGEDQENSNGQKATNTSLSGHMVKYQPSLNETAKSMLRQLLKTSSSPRYEPFPNSPDGFLLDDIPSPSGLDNGKSSNRVSGVTLAEVSPDSSRLPMSSSPSIKSQDPCKPNQSPETKMPQSLADLGQPNLAPKQMAAASSPDSDLAGCEVDNGESMDPIVAVLEGSKEVEADAISPEESMNELLDEDPKLPAIHDSFWEQFFATSPVIGDIDEIMSRSMENEFGMEQELQANYRNGWNKNQHMDHLTEQMGLLRSEAQMK